MVALPSTSTTFNPFSSALNHVSLLTSSSQENYTKHHQPLVLYPLQQAGGTGGAVGASLVSEGLTRALLELRAAEESLLLANRQHQPTPWLINKFMASYSSPMMMTTTSLSARRTPVESPLSHQQSLLQALHFQQCTTSVAPATPSSASSTPSIDDGPLEKSTAGAAQQGRGLKDVDILCGRGGKSNHHIGNKRFRKLVSDMKARYKNIDTKMAKTELSRAIVEHVHRQGGRFVRFDKETSTYVSMSVDDARKKTSQALRESKNVKWIL